MSDSRALPYHRRGVDLGACDTSRGRLYRVGDVPDLSELATTLRLQSARAKRPSTWELRDANALKLRETKGGMLELLFGVSNNTVQKNVTVTIARDAVLAKSFQEGDFVTAVVDKVEYKRCKVKRCDAYKVVLGLKKRTVKGYCALGFFGIIDLIDSFCEHGPACPTLARTVNVLPARGHDGCALGEYRTVSDPRWANIRGKLRSANGVSL